MSRFHGNYADVGKAADYVLDASGGDSIVVPDAHLLFTGVFKRVGPDLLIDGDGRRISELCVRVLVASVTDETHQ